MAGLLLECDAGLRVDLLRRQHHVIGQLLAAKPDHDRLAAEVRMLNDVADGADGNARLARTDGHAAAVGVRDGHHALDVRIFRQQLPPDTLRDAPDDARAHRTHRTVGRGV